MNIRTRYINVVMVVSFLSSTLTLQAELNPFDDFEAHANSDVVSAAQPSFIRAHWIKIVGTITAAFLAGGAFLHVRGQRSSSRTTSPSGSDATTHAPQGSAPKDTTRSVSEQHPSDLPSEEPDRGKDTTKKEQTVLNPEKAKLAAGDNHHRDVPLKQQDDALAQARKQEEARLKAEQDRLRKEEDLLKEKTQLDYVVSPFLTSAKDRMTARNHFKHFLQSIETNLKQTFDGELSRKNFIKTGVLHPDCISKYIKSLPKEISGVCPDLAAYLARHDNTVPKGILLWYQEYEVIRSIEAYVQKKIGNVSWVVEEPVFPQHYTMVHLLEKFLQGTYDTDKEIPSFLRSMVERFAGEYESIKADVLPAHIEAFFRTADVFDNLLKKGRSDWSAYSDSDALRDHDGFSPIHVSSSGSSVASGSRSLTSYALLQDGTESSPQSTKFNKPVAKADHGSSSTSYALLQDGYSTPVSQPATERTDVFEAPTWSQAQPVATKIVPISQYQPTYPWE